MAVDALRSCYQTSMRFFADSDEVTVIRWYFTDGPYIEYPTVFTSRNWSNDWEYHDSLGEQQGAVRTWKNGTIQSPPKTFLPFGNEQQWMGIGTSIPDTPVPLDPDGWPLGYPLRSKQVMYATGGQQQGYNPYDIQSRAGQRQGGRGQWPINPHGGQQQGQSGVFCECSSDGQEQGGTGLAVATARDGQRQGGSEGDFTGRAFGGQQQGGNGISVMLSDPDQEQGQVGLIVFPSSGGQQQGGSGEFSQLNPQVGNYTGTTTSGAATVFNTTNTGGMNGSMMIKNTGGSNQLQWQVTVTDMFGSAFVTGFSFVAPGNKASLNYETAANGCPVQTVKLEVKDGISGSHTTYSVYDSHCV